jgi:hypothetical protein
MAALQNAQSARGGSFTICAPVGTPLVFVGDLTASSLPLECLCRANARREAFYLRAQSGQQHAQIHVRADLGGVSRGSDVAHGGARTAGADVCPTFIHP